ncbi:ABC transporter ATP-binding protein [Nonomuraea sp. NPDC049646]|uniref:ABC transporter ATP-binding protein n=1 Tax=unclassified Nonomuraea TaxID=2593643 RepID=UPI00379A26E4
MWKKMSSGTPVRNVLPAISLAWRAGAPWATSITVLALLSALIPISMAWLTKLLLDRLTNGAQLSTVLLLAGFLAFLGLLISGSAALRRYCDAEHDRRVNLYAQDTIYRAVNNISGLAKFEDPKFLDQLRLAAQAGGNTPSQVFQAALGLFAGSLTIGGFAVSLLLISPMMAAATIVGAVPMLLAEISLAKRHAVRIWRMSPTERREIAYSQLISTTAAAKEVRLFGLGDFFHTRMLDERRAIDEEKRLMDRATLRVQFGLGVLGAVIAGAGLVWTAAQALNGRLTLGDITMYVASIAGVQAGLSALVSLIASAYQQLTLFGHYQEIVSLPAESRAEIRNLPAAFDCIEFKDVWFRYGPDHPWVLRGINLTIPFGSSLGLVGENGSGKSTLVKLLCRFYEPTEGTILWNGVDTREIDVKILRSRISAVFQDFMEYDLSAAENIGVGDIEKIDDRALIEESARRAGVHQTLAALPKGYDNLLTRFFLASDDSEGVRLSGGQAQRVAVARSLLREGRDLLILDEPSSGLDAAAEHDIHAGLREYRKGSTSILISHRLSTVRDADMLAVLADGGIAECGTHSELISLDGIYARLFNLQASGYQETVPG